jgi:glycosyltransferase involved in cell wall biosynthesis
MKKRISLLLPTRGRRKLAERFLSSVAAQSAHPELIEVIVCVDEDDIESHGIASDELALNVIVVPRQSMGGYNAICLAHATGEITIAVNDDIIVRTRGWDEKVRELDARYPDGVYLGYGNDLFKGAKLSTFPILSREACRVLGEPYPRIYMGAFIDVHLMDIFRRLEKRGYARIAYAEDIVFEHLHYRKIAEAFDATYGERLRFGDDQTFIALIDSRRLEADRLLARIFGRTRPPVRSVPPIIRPTSAIGIVPLCIRRFFFDRDLPLGWRSYLCAWMIGRYYFSKLRGIG